MAKNIVQHTLGIFGRVARVIAQPDRSTNFIKHHKKYMAAAKAEKDKHWQESRRHALALEANAQLKTEADKDHHRNRVITSVIQNAADIRAAQKEIDKEKAAKQKRADDTENWFRERGYK